ncbi:YagB/YeeU/YfjZ family protein, partial [Escherichia coli]|nr:YagB/YeeU/YfjZ family protein [Escherichia coli]
LYAKGLPWPTPPAVVVMFIWLFIRHR